MHERSRNIAGWTLLGAALLAAGCASARFIPTGTPYPPRAPDCPIEVFSTRVPDRPYEELGIIEGEGELFGMASLEAVLPKMKEEACAAGGDALVLMSSSKSFDVSGSVSEGDGVVTSTEKLDVVATVIRWTEPE